MLNPHEAMEFPWQTLVRSRRYLDSGFPPAVANADGLFRKSTLGEGKPLQTPTDSVHDRRGTGNAQHQKK
jgi:hypothetical protein